MRVFRASLAVAFGHPVYLAIYVVFLSLLGVLLSCGVDYVDEAALGFERERACVAVVDRDGTELSRALGRYVERTQDTVDVSDSPEGLQGALATGLVDVVLIVPDGFESAVLSAARSGGEMPSLQTSYGAYALASALAEQDAARWASLAVGAAALRPEANVEEVARLTEAAAASRAEVDVAALAPSSGPAHALRSYLAFSTYTITCSVVVCAGLVFSRIGEGKFRSRTLVSPVSPRRVALGSLGACVVLTGAVVVLTGAVGMVSSGAYGSAVEPARLAIAMLAMATYSLVPLSLAFLLAQLGIGENALNALGNLGGMAMSFLGGAWVPIAFMGEGVQAAARFVPTHWTIDAVSVALLSSSLSSDGLARIAVDLGVTALFAALSFGAAVLVSGARARRGR